MTCTRPQWNQSSCELHTQIPQSNLRSDTLSPTQSQAPPLSPAALSYFLTHWKSFSLLLSVCFVFMYSSFPHLFSGITCSCCHKLTGWYYCRLVNCSTFLEIPIFAFFPRVTLENQRQFHFCIQNHSLFTIQCVVFTVCHFIWESYSVCKWIHNIVPSKIQNGMKH